MLAPLLATKLYIPAPRPQTVARPHLSQRLNMGLHTPAGFSRKLTLISAPAGFGKTTLVSAWLTHTPARVAWLSLDVGDNDPARFLTYFVAALQTVEPHLGQGLLSLTQIPQPPPLEVLLTTLLNELTALSSEVMLVLDDYHLIDSPHIDQGLSFLLDHLPPRLHLVITTREDPALPLPRLRARHQMAELRIADLRFTPAEAAEFINHIMGLPLAASDIAALEARTEGWIAGLQLAALALQGTRAAAGDAARFIQSFTGSHHFVVDYLAEEVLHQQPAPVQHFLLHTAILDRLCGPLCEAVLGATDPAGQATLEHLERANLFIVPLDNERRWYRYHQLFADLLRQRLPASLSPTLTVAELHRRASQWYEDNGLALEAFRHAAAANDIDRAIRLIGGDRIPQHFRGAVTLILDWLATLPPAELDARPWLWWRYASLLLVNGHTTGVAEKLQAAENALPNTAATAATQELIGQIATARAVLALTQYNPAEMVAQSHRALAHLPPERAVSRATAHWTLGYAHLLQGNRPAARQALTTGIAIAQAAGDVFTTLLASIGLGNVQELDNQLPQAAATYQQMLQLAGNQPLQIVHEAHLGLARVFYEWDDLAAAQQQAEQSLHLARQYERVIDRFIACEVCLARIKLAQGAVAEAAALLAQTAQTAQQPRFKHRLPEIAAARVWVLLRQGDLPAAAQLAQTYPLPLCQARVFLAQGQPTAALPLLAAFHQNALAKGWADEQLKALLLQALAHHALGDNALALQHLAAALAIAEPGGFIRTFVDEGPNLAELLRKLEGTPNAPQAYLQKLLLAFGTAPVAPTPSRQPLVEPLSARELEVLQLIAQGLSNEAIGQRLHLALDTVKGHNRKIFEKLAVQRRTEAVARARALGLL